MRHVDAKTNCPEEGCEDVDAFLVGGPVAFLVGGPVRSGRL